MASEMTNSATVIPESPLKAELKEFWFYFSENKGAVAGLYVIIGIILLAVFADLVAPYEANQQFRDFLLTPPVWQDGGTSQFILGTDDVGRDILSRLIYGTRYSLYIGSIVIFITLSVGIVLGLTAGFFRGWWETLIMRIMDIILSVPSLLMALVLVAILEPGLGNAMIAISITYLPHYVRLIRASTINEFGRDYVTASRIVGAGKIRLMFVSILPNCLAPLIVQATLSFSSAILDAAALGFLGMGAQPPTPEWGTMCAEAREFILSAWWVITFPGLAILIAVLSINLLGDGLRDALDPKMKRS